MNKVCAVIKKIEQKINPPRYYIGNFLNVINHKGTLLDVGCGNNSP